MKHTKYCKENFRKFEEFRKQWIKKWPNYCQKCGGWGGFEGYQSVPYGMGSTSMPVFDTCDECIERGKCPRCGKYTFKQDDRELCRNCGFDIAGGKNSEGIPDEPECMCWLDEQRKELEEK
jgi:hypothetical protein